MENAAIPNLSMLREGFKSKKIDDFFTDIPEKILINDLDIPEGISEQEVKTELKNILKKNIIFEKIPFFFGGPIKPHYIPSAVKSILNRSEFYTSYTPYQPEFSQGILQALFEYQSMMSELTGMDVINISMYDSSSALGEAALMSARISQKKYFLIPSNITWEKKAVLKNYSEHSGIKIKEIPFTEQGLIDLSFVDVTNTAGVYIENPNFFGLFDYRLEEIRDLCTDTCLVVGTNPLSLPLLKTPNFYGADIVISEGQGFGNPMNFGGSLLGVFGCRKKYVRMMPGKIIGATRDSIGQRAFCMTLQTREQHIRRVRATSNICSNETLCAIASAVYLSLLGGKGLTDLAVNNMEKAKYLADRLHTIGFSMPFESAFFNDFVMNAPGDVDRINRMLLKKEIYGGLSLKKQFPELGDAVLFGVTETHTKKMMDKLIDTLKSIQLT